MKCPECGSDNAWIGVHIHCTNKDCRHFDEKLMHQVLDENLAEAVEKTSSDWDEDTKPYGYTRFVSTDDLSLATLDWRDLK